MFMNFKAVLMAAKENFTSRLTSELAPQQMRQTLADIANVHAQSRLLSFSPPDSPHCVCCPFSFPPPIKGLRMTHGCPASPNLHSNRLGENWLPARKKWKTTVLFSPGGWGWCLRWYTVYHKQSQPVKPLGGEKKNHFLFKNPDDTRNLQHKKVKECCKDLLTLLCCHDGAWLNVFITICTITCFFLEKPMSKERYKKMSVFVVELNACDEKDEGKLLGGNYSFKA